MCLALSSTRLEIFGSLELCRQCNRIFEIVIVTHLFDVPQLKLKIRPFELLRSKDLSVALLSLLRHIVQFSRSVLPTAFAARSEDPIFQVFRSNNKPLFGGPEWARTTDLTIISRTL